MEIWVEFAFCLVLFFLWFYLDRLRARSVGLGLTGWTELLWGVFFLFVGSIVDVSENLPHLNRLLTIGNMHFSSVIKVGFYVLGILLVLISPLNWLSVLLQRKMKAEDEERKEKFLTLLIDELKDKSALSDLFTTAFPEVIGFLKAKKGATFLISGEELVLSFSSGLSKEEIDPLKQFRMEDDAISWCAKNNRSKMVKSLFESEKKLAGLIRDEEIRCLICTPLSSREKVLGVLAFFSKTEFKEGDLPFLTSLGKGMGEMVQYMNYETEIRVKKDKLLEAESQRKLLRDLFEMVSDSSAEKILNEIVLAGVQMIRSDSCKIFEIDEQNKIATITASSEPDSVRKKIVIQDSPNMIEVVEKREIVFKTFEAPDSGGKSFLVLPLYIGDQTLGGLVFEFREYSPASTEVEIDLARSLAGFASPILYHQRLSKESQAGEKVPELEEGEEEEIKAKTLKILAIDDQKSMRDLLDDMSRSLGYQMALAADGKRGLEMFEEDNFDLVITELDLPGSSGWDISRKVKNSRPNVLVALMTEMSPVKKLLNTYGVDFVLVKPFRLDQLIQIIQKAKLMRNRWSQR
jgi:CheY-like chemotaxis protein